MKICLLSFRRFYVLLLIASALSFCGLFSAHGADGAPVLQATVGDLFLFGVETALPEPTFSWTLERGSQMLTAQSEHIFSYTFPEKGDASLSLFIRGANGEQEEWRFPVQVNAPVQLSADATVPVRAVLRTEPSMQLPERVLTLPLAGGSIIIFADESVGNIREYHVDTDAARDSDGDGDPANDAENRAHPSFRTGEAFPVSIVPAPGETERTLVVRVVGERGERSEARCIVRFTSTAGPTAQLTIFPIGAERDSFIHLPAEGGVVRLDASRSGGGVRSFSLDVDTNRDANQNGRFDDDNFFEDTPFASRGAPANLFLRPLGGVASREMALIVRDASGQESLLRRQILFGDALPSVPGSASSTIQVEGGVIRVGTPFTLSVQNSPENTAVFVWDVPADGTPDAQTQTPRLQLQPDTPGALPIRVLFRDASGQELGAAELQENVLSMEAGSGQTVLSPQSDTLRIDVVTEGLRVRVRPVGMKEAELTSLFATWSFGDDATSQLLAPEHIYTAAGTYTITLTLIDPASGIQIASIQTPVTVEGVAVITPPASNTAASIIRFFVGMFTIALWTLLLLSFIAGVILFPLSFFAKRKGLTLRQLFHDPSKLFEAHAEEHVETVMPEILSNTEQQNVSDELPPMRLDAENADDDFAISEKEEELPSEPEESLSEEWSPFSVASQQTEEPSSLPEPEPEVPAPPLSAAEEPPSPAPPSTVAPSAPPAEEKNEPPAAEPPPESVAAPATPEKEPPVPSPPVSESASSVASVPPPASKTDAMANVPAWLQQGIEKAEEVGETQDSPPPPALQTPAPVPPAEVAQTPEPMEVPLSSPKKENAPVAQNPDEPIAMIRAEVGEKKEEKANQDSTEEQKKEGGAS